jgi:hypothetical protein
MTGKTIASAIRHFGRICTVAFDTGRHRLVPFIGINIF